MLIIWIVTMLSLVCGFAQISATETLPNTDDRSVFLEDKMQTESDSGLSDDYYNEYGYYGDDDDDAEDSYDDSYYYNYDDEEGSGSGVSLGDDEDGDEPVAQRPFILPSGDYRQSGVSATTVNVTDSVAKPQRLLSGRKEQESSSYVGNILFACIIGMCVLLFLIVILVILLVLRCQQGHYSRQTILPIYRHGYMRAVNRECEV